MVAPPCDLARPGFFYAPTRLTTGHPRSSFNGWSRSRGNGCRNPESRQELLLASILGASGMFPIRTVSIDTAGTIYPSLCPGGYDPVLEYQTRVASALLLRNRHFQSAPGSTRESSIRLRPASTPAGETIAGDRGIDRAARRGRETALRPARPISRDGDFSELALDERRKS